MVELVIGGMAEGCAAAFLDAVQRAERGEAVEPRRVLAFQGWRAWRRHGPAEGAALLAGIEAEELGAEGARVPRTPGELGPAPWLGTLPATRNGAGADGRSTLQPGKG